MAATARIRSASTGRTKYGNTPQKAIKSVNAEAHLPPYNFNIL